MGKFRYAWLHEWRNALRPTLLMLGQWDALPDPIAAIQFRMEQSGLGIKDLEPLIGKPNRVYEIFNGTRKLTLPMIRRLHRELKIPLESLIQV